MNAATTLKKFGLEQAFHYIYKDPDKNMLKIMDWAAEYGNKLNLSYADLLFRFQHKTAQYGSQSYSNTA